MALLQYCFFLTHFNKWKVSKSCCVSEIFIINTNLRKIQISEGCIKDMTLKIMATSVVLFAFYVSKFFMLVSMYYTYLFCLRLCPTDKVNVNALKWQSSQHVMLISNFILQCGQRTYETTNNKCFVLQVENFLSTFLDMLQYTTPSKLFLWIFNCDLWESPEVS